MKKIAYPINQERAIDSKKEKSDNKFGKADNLTIFTQSLKRRRSHHTIFVQSRYFLKRAYCTYYLTLVQYTILGIDYIILVEKKFFHQHISK